MSFSTYYRAAATALFWISNSGLRSLRLIVSCAIYLLASSSFVSPSDNLFWVIKASVLLVFSSVIKSLIKSRYDLGVKYTFLLRAYSNFSVYICDFLWISLERKDRLLIRSYFGIETDSGKLVSSYKSLIETV